MSEYTHEDETNVLWNIKTMRLDNKDIETTHIMWMDGPPADLEPAEWMIPLLEAFYDMGELPFEISFTEGEGLTKIVGVSV